MDDSVILDSFDELFYYDSLDYTEEIMVLTDKLDSLVELNTLYHNNSVEFFKFSLIVLGLFIGLFIGSLFVKVAFK